MIDNVSLSITSSTPSPFMNGGVWKKGTFGPVSFCALVFDEPSRFGIKRGRVSKLQVSATADLPTRGWNPTYALANYDRGWDTKPQGEVAQAAVDAILGAFR